MAEGRAEKIPKTAQWQSQLLRRPRCRPRLTPARGPATIGPPDSRRQVRRSQACLCIQTASSRTVHSVYPARAGTGECARCVDHLCISHGHPFQHLREIAARRKRPPPQGTGCRWHGASATIPRLVQSFSGGLLMTLVAVETSWTLEHRSAESGPGIQDLARLVVSQSSPSYNPWPEVAHVAWMCQMRFRSAHRPNFSTIRSASMELGRSC